MIASSAVLAFGHVYHGCALAPDGQHGWVVTRDTFFIFHTANGGVDWESQDPPSGYNRVFYDIFCLDPLKAWTCSELGQVLHTSDGGSIWTQQPIQFTNYSHRIFFIDSGYGWVTGSDGCLCITTDGGNSWDLQFLEWYNMECQGLSFITHTKGWMVSGQPDSISTGEMNIIVMTNDGGMHWDSLYSLPPLDFLDVHFSDSLYGIVIGGNDNDHSALIIRSINGGYAWSQIQPPNNSQYLWALDFVGDKGWAVGDNGTIIHTTDQGQSWTFQTNPATTILYDVDFGDTLNGIACGDNIILYTIDAGQTWNPANRIAEYNDQTMIGQLFMTVAPNPFRTTTTFSIKHRAERRELNIYDASGRLIRSFILPTTYSLPPTVVWGGTDDNGCSVPMGVYFATLGIGEGAAIKKIVKLE